MMPTATPAATTSAAAPAATQRIQGALEPGRSSALIPLPAPPVNSGCTALPEPVDRPSLADSSAQPAVSPPSHSARHAATSRGRSSGHTASAAVTAAPNAVLTLPAATAATGGSGSGAWPERAWASTRAPRAMASTRSVASAGARPVNARYATAPSE